LCRYPVAVDLAVVTFMVDLVVALVLGDFVLIELAFVTLLCDFLVDLVVALVLGDFVVVKMAFVTVLCDFMVDSIVALVLDDFVVVELAFVTVYFIVELPVNTVLFEFIDDLSVATVL